MMQEWEDRPDWRGETRWQTILRKQYGLTPHQEIRVWKRRFWTLFVSVIALGALAGLTLRLAQ